MNKLKLSLIIRSFLVFVIFPGELNCLYLEIQVNRSTDAYCDFNIIPLQYEIHIGPIQNTSGDSVRVKAWTKITVQISELNCKLNDSNFNQSNYCVKLNTRNCQIDTKTVNITYLDNGKNIQFNLTNQLWANKTANDITNTELCIIFQDKISFEDQILFYIPYKIELTREYSEKSWQGLYYYDPRGINKTNVGELYNYYPLHSKYMFPVFDYYDPVRKPTFKISVARYASDNFISVSNSEVVMETTDMDENGWVIDHFQETPPMKLDQVTVMILRNFQNYTLQSRGKSVSRNCTINLWLFKNTSFGNDSIVQTSQEIQKLVDFYGQMFNKSELPLNKIDFIALPMLVEYMDSFSNLGIIVTGDYKLLLDEGDLDVNPNAFQRVTSFLSFQITQQWFHGILTSALPPTPELDKDVWIAGEGLANYVAKWPMWEFYEECMPPLRNYRSNIGNDLLMMMESVFSRAVIQTAIVNFYLPKTLHSGALPDDLYDAIEQAIVFHNMTQSLPSEGNVTVADIIQSWLNNKHYWPTINIYEIQNDTSSVKIYQENTIVGGPTNFWWVPIKILSMESEHILWLSPNHTLASKSSKKWTSPNKIDTRTDWLVIIPEGMAYYSVKYSDKLLKNIANQLQLNHSIFSPDRRNYLIQNQYNLLDYAEWESIQSALEISKYLDNEMDYNVWSTVTGFVSVYDFIDQPNSFTKYFGRKINSVMDKIGMTPEVQEDINITKLRRLLMSMCAKAEILICRSYGRKLMTKWMNDSTRNPFKSEEYPGNLYCEVIRNESEDLTEGQSAFHFLLNQLVTGSSILKGYDLHICRALSCVKSDDLLRELLGNKSQLWEHDSLLNCYRDTLPDEILLNRRYSMTQAVYELWMRLTLEGKMLPASLLRRLWQLASLNGDETRGFVDKILEFLNTTKDLFDEDLVGSVDSFKAEIIKPIYSGHFWRDGVTKMDKWVDENL